MLSAATCRSRRDGRESAAAKVEAPPDVSRLHHREARRLSLSAPSPSSGGPDCARLCCGSTFAATLVDAIFRAIASLSQPFNVVLQNVCECCSYRSGARRGDIMVRSSTDARPAAADGCAQGDDAAAAAAFSLGCARALMLSRRSPPRMGVTGTRIRTDLFTEVDCQKQARSTAAPTSEAAALDRLAPVMQLAAEAVAAGDVSAITPYLQGARPARPLPDGRQRQPGL